MDFNETEIRTIKAVFYDLLCKSDSELNSFIGSETIKEMRKLYHKLDIHDFCKEHNITYEEYDNDEYWAEMHYHEKYDA